MAKDVGKSAESAKVIVRNIRRDAIDELKKLEKNKEISEDELHKLEKDVQVLTDNSTKEMDAITKTKEEELLDV